MKLTFKEMCVVIAEDWNKDALKSKQLTHEDIWKLDLVQEFPALYLPILYDAAKDGNLIGLIFTDNTCAGMFVRYLNERV